MDPIRRGVRLARRRLITQAFVAAASRGFLLGLLLGIVFILADRLFFTGLNPLHIAGVLVAAPVGVCLALALLRLPGRDRAARELDLRYDLKERVSTAVSLEESATPIAEAVRADARRSIQELDLGGASGLRFPRELWWAGGVLVVLALLASKDVLPYVDLFGRAHAWDKLQVEAKEVKLQAKSLLDRQEKLKKKLQGKKLEGVEETLKEWKEVALDLQKNPGSRKSALVKISKLTDSIREKQNRSKYRSLGRMAKALSLSAKPSKETSSLRAALQKGDLDAAAKALDALQKRMEAGDLSPEALKRLGEELKSLSLDLAATPELSRSFEEAALDIADDELQAALQDLEEAEMSLEELAEALGEMAFLEEALADLEIQKRGLFLDEEDLAALEAHICDDCGANMEEAWKGLDAKIFGPKREGDGECSSCKGEGGDCEDCDGSGKGDDSEKGENSEGGEEKGSRQNEGGKAGKKAGKLVCRRCLLGGHLGQRGGMGGPGRGAGGKIPDEPGQPAKYQKFKVRGRVGKGRIVGELFVKGPQAKGEVSGEYVEVVGEARQEAADALSKQRIPQSYRDFIREYFNSLDPDQDE